MKLDVNFTPVAEYHNYVAYHQVELLYLFLMIKPAVYFGKNQCSKCRLICLLNYCHFHLFPREWKTTGPSCMKGWSECAVLYEGMKRVRRLVWTDEASAPSCMNGWSECAVLYERMTQVRRLVWTDESSRLVRTDETSPPFQCLLNKTSTFVVIIGRPIFDLISIACYVSMPSFQ